jgi:hypothetical protein
MSTENVHGDSPCSTSTLDPRIRILREHYFSIRPAPLEEWLWQQALPASAERVFWVHWQEGQKRGDFCSEIPLRTVARRCHLNVSSVTRAYQKLERLGCLKRTDPGRNLANPFCQATALTEVFLPKVLLGALSCYPRRGRRPASTHQRDSTPSVASPTELSQNPPASSQCAPALEENAASSSDSERPTAPVSPAPKDPLAGLTGRQRLLAMSGWRDAMTAIERCHFDSAIRESRPAIAFDAGTRLSAEGQAQVLELLRYLAQRPSSASTAPSPTAHTGPIPPRAPRLGVSQIATLRGKLISLRGLAASDELLRQIAWSIEHGALTKFPVPKAMAIALRKVREDAWTRPHRMPPNWRPTARNTSYAAVHN